MQTKATPAQSEAPKATAAAAPVSTTANPFRMVTAEEEEAVQMKTANEQLPPSYTRNPLQMKQPSNNPFAPKPYTQNPLQLKTSTQNPLQLITYSNPFQRKAAPAAEQQKPKKENNTGLPDNLKQGVEALSGYSMDDVKVHYNSHKPAQLQALAYAQGTNIHVAPGQEQHLPHEAWHVVQQKQGRVQPTVQMKEGIAVNDDKGLENEADKMGEKAKKQKESQYHELSNTVMQQKEKTLNDNRVTNGKITPGRQDLKNYENFVKFSTNKVYQRTILTEASNIVDEEQDILTMEEGKPKAAELEVINATRKMQKLTNMQVVRIGSGSKINPNEELIIIAHRDKESFTRMPPAVLVKQLIEQFGAKDGMKITLLGCHTDGEKVAGEIRKEFNSQNFTKIEVTGYADIMIIGEKGPVAIEHNIATEWWEEKGSVIQDFETKIGRSMYKEFNTYLNTLDEKQIVSYAEALNDSKDKEIKTTGRYINIKTMLPVISNRAKEAFTKGNVIKNAQRFLWDLQGALDLVDAKQTNTYFSFVAKIEELLEIHSKGIREIQEKYELFITTNEKVSKNKLMPTQTLDTYQQQLN